jgi:hypothetical protein
VMAMSVVSATWRRIITVTRLRRRVLAELQPMTRRDQAERLRKEWQTSPRLLLLRENRCCLQIFQHPGHPEWS